jgi:hypothetical protein
MHYLRAVSSLQFAEFPGKDFRMSHQDMESEVINHQALKQAIDLLMPAAAFRSVKVRAGATWKARMLATAAFVMGCMSIGPLDERFGRARRIADKMFRSFPSPGKTYEGFKKVLKSKHAQIKLLLMESWRERMRAMPARELVEGFDVLAVDGSRVELPRTRSHEEHYSPSRKSKKKSGKKNPCNKHSRNKNSRKRNSKKKNTKRANRNSRRGESESTKKKRTSPQMWLTLLWHVGTGLPWNWKTGPSDSSERDHLREMLPDLPKNTLITADAGFVGYEFWKSIVDANLSFVIRVGGNVKLIRNLGVARQHDQTVYLWPDEARRRSHPPLVLRLIVLHGGKQPVYLVTNLPKSKLTDRQAARVYHARWGIEVFFRTYKQTFLRRKLRSHKPEYAELELDWSLLALWGMLLVGQLELHASGQAAARQSPVQTIRAFQTTITEYRIRPATDDYSLWLGLRTAVLDEPRTTRDKSSRDYPKKKQRERTSAPKIITATKQQILAAQQLKQTKQEFRLAA